MSFLNPSSSAGTMAANAQAMAESAQQAAAAHAAEIVSLKAGSACYGQVSFASASPSNLSLTANTFTVLTGGSLAVPARQTSYSAGAGELTVNLGGDYLVSGTLISERVIGLATNVTCAVFVNGVQSSLVIQDNTGVGLAERETNSASQILRLAAGDRLTVRTRSVLAITLGVTMFSLGLFRIGE